MPSATRWAYLAEMLFLFFVFVAASTLVRAKPFPLLMQTARLLESPDAAFITAQPQGRSKHIFTKKAETGKCIEMPFAVTTFPVKKYLRNDRSRFGDTNIKILFPLMMAKANAAAIFNRAALPKALPGFLLCRNISRRDCPAPAQGRPDFPAVALPPVLPSGQSGAVRRARRALSGTAWLTPLPQRWKQPRRSACSTVLRRQPAGRRYPCSMHRGCRCSTG